VTVVWPFITWTGAYKYDSSDTWHYYSNGQPAGESYAPQRRTVPSGYYYAILNWVYDAGRQKWERGISRDVYGSTSYYCRA
jgi:hypothetical protein